MGVSGEDIQFSDEVAKQLDISVECKSRSSIGVYSFYEQAVQHSNKNFREPVVVIKQNRSKPLVVIDAEYFIKLLLHYTTKPEEYLKYYDMYIEIKDAYAKDLVK